MERNVETFLGCDKTFEEARIVIFGAPFDSTTSYRPGTRFASRTMRAESYGLETYSPYQDLDLEDAAVFDGYFSFSVIFSFLAILQVLQCAFLIFHVF